MNQEQIAVMFRKGELERRRQRHEQLLRNEAALRDEPLTEFDKKVHEQAVTEVKKYKLAIEKETSPGYWARLWRALLNR